MKWDIEHYTDDISRLEREIAKITLSLTEYKPALRSYGRVESVLITDMPDGLKGLQ